MRIRPRPTPGGKPSEPLAGSVAVGSLSIHDPIHLGIDALGAQLQVRLAYRNLLIGGDPHSGKSAGISNLLGHAALCDDVDLVLLDGRKSNSPCGNHWPPGLWALMCRMRSSA